MCGRAFQEIAAEEVGIELLRGCLCGAKVTDAVRQLLHDSPRSCACGIGMNNDVKH